MIQSPYHCICWYFSFILEGGGRKNNDKWNHFLMTFSLNYGQRNFEWPMDRPGSQLESYISDLTVNFQLIKTAVKRDVY